MSVSLCLWNLEVFVWVFKAGPCSCGYFCSLIGSCDQIYIASSMEAQFLDEQQINGINRRLWDVKNTQFGKSPREEEWTIIARGTEILGILRNGRIYRR